MPDDLLTYYERELSFLRQMGAEFATKYPKIAGRLLLEADKSEDPHVERLIQAFAFLAARVHHKLDDDFPEITDALLGVLYPHYLAPIPSMALVEFVLDPEQGKLTTAHRIDRGATLYSQPVGGSPVPLPYLLSGDPVARRGDLGSARLTRPAWVRPAGPRPSFGWNCAAWAGRPSPELGLDQLRFFLHGESSLAYALYELLFNNAIQVQLRLPRAGRVPNRSSCHLGACRPVGFAPDEGMLPYTPRSFLGYRLLQEYFSFPEKFLFFDLLELDRAARAGFKERVEIAIFLDRMPSTRAADQRRDLPAGLYADRQPVRADRRADPRESRRRRSTG